MKLFVQYFLRTVIIVIAVLIALRFIALVLMRAPGFIVAVTLVTSCLLGFALYKGSFRLIGLHSRRAVLWVLLISVFLLFLSTGIMLSVNL